MALSWLSEFAVEPFPLPMRSIEAPMERAVRTLHRLGFTDELFIEERGFACSALLTLVPSLLLWRRLNTSLRWPFRVVRRGIGLYHRRTKVLAYFDEATFNLYSIVEDGTLVVSRRASAHPTEQVRSQWLEHCRRLDSLAKQDRQVRRLVVGEDIDTIAFLERPWRGFAVMVCALIHVTCYCQIIVELTSR